MRRANIAVKKLLESAFGKPKIKAKDFYDLKREIFFIKISVLLLILLIILDKI